MMKFALDEKYCWAEQLGSSDQPVPLVILLSGDDSVQQLSDSPTFTSCPTLTAIALTRPGIGHRRKREPSTPLRSIISAASCASRRV